MPRVTKINALGDAVEQIKAVPEGLNIVLRPISGFNIGFSRS